MESSYTKNSDEVINELKTNEEGLSSSEANERLLKYGKNEIKKQKKKSIIKMILMQLTDKMIIILMVAAILSLILGEKVETIVIFIIIFINTAISVIQEKKALVAVEALRNMNAPLAIVKRDGKFVTIPASEVVVGDIVHLEAGGIVPADVRLIRTSELQIDESALTGESIPVYKDAKAILSENEALGDRVNMAYSSSIITFGTGIGVVVATGMNTEVGKIARMLDSEDELNTPLKEKLNAVGKVLSIVGIVISILIFIIGLLYGRDVVTLLLISISLAISVIPEGLPATATIVMALGVQRMAKRNALVKNLSAVETLGSASVICSDKTGTLTQNKMTVVDYLLYDDLLLDKKSNMSNDFLLGLMLCNNASIDNGEIGDPTETALLTYVKKINPNLYDLRGTYRRVFEDPFDSERKRMSVVCNVDGQNVCFTKGALEELILLCPYILHDNEVLEFTLEMKEKVLNKCTSLSGEAYRILGVAKKNIDYVPSENENIENDLIFIGLVCMIDPPRKEVIKAIKTFKEAGIYVIMITGDHKLTATAISKKLGMYEEGNMAITGVELQKMSDEELRKNISKIAVFARVAPEDKLKIVNALQANGDVVAMMGDGVNDSPALKKADIGVAMGKTGTDVAKNAADMLLLDDNFTTIEVAIREGRRVYRNIQKVIQFLLSGNVAEVLVMFVATVFNFNAPLLAIHILFVNLVTDTLPALALGVDPENENIMKQKPVKHGSLFEKGLVFRVVFYGIFIAFISLIAYFIGINRSYEVGVTMTFLVICLSQIVHSLNQHSNTLSIFDKRHPRNKYLYGAMFLAVLCVLFLVCVPAVSSFFSLVSLTFNEWLIVILLSISPLVMVEIFKFIKRHRNV